MNSNKDLIHLFVLKSSLIMIFISLLSSATNVILFDCYLENTFIFINKIILFKNVLIAQFKSLTHGKNHLPFISFYYGLLQF